MLVLILALIASTFAADEPNAHNGIGVSYGNVVYMGDIWVNAGVRVAQDSRGGLVTFMDGQVQVAPGNNSAYLYGLDFGIGWQPNHWGVGGLINIELSSVATMVDCVVDCPVYLGPQVRVWQDLLPGMSADITVGYSILNTEPSAGLNVTYYFGHRHR